jgi:uncharacterized protein DUF4178
MAAQPLQSEPLVGQSLEVEGRRWRVTDHSSSWSEADKYYVDEWECEGDGGVAYLLREGEQPVKWFFARTIPTESLTLDGTRPFTGWTARDHTPPGSLVYRGVVYQYKETTDATYQEEPGQTQARTTWEYWDAAGAWNVAVEHWPDGHIACYHGRYVDKSAILVSAVTVSGPAGALVLGGGMFFVMLVVGYAVDVALTQGLLMLALAGFMFTLRSWTLGVPWVLGATVVGLIVLRYPPLTSVPGLAALLLTAAVATRWSGLRAAAETSARAPMIAAIAMTVAVMPSAMYHYFSLAPVPHTFGQWVLALGPAPISGVVAMLIAWLVLRLSDATK